MRIKKPHPFEPGREYNPGERAVYRGMVIIAERWVKPSDKLIEKVGKFVCLSRCACCVIHKDDCPAVGLKCYRTSRSDNKVIYFRKLYNITEKKAMKKIFQLIVSIPHDKLLHIIAGMIVIMLVLRLVSFIGIPGMIARIIALIAVILTGVLREVYNKKHGGVFDKKDLYATISGGLIVLLLTVY